MQINKKSNTAVISIDNLSDMLTALGEKGKTQAAARVEECISNTLGEVCDVYSINDNTFACVSTINIRSYISQFKDAIGFSEIKEKYPLKVTVKYENDAL